MPLMGYGVWQIAPEACEQYVLQALAAGYRSIDTAQAYYNEEGVGEAIVYFADSYSAWQKGAIENANKLIRKYIPKKADFNDFTDVYIKKVQYKLNKRPREKLQFDTPKLCFFKNIL